MKLIDADLFKNYITYGYLNDTNEKRFSTGDVIEMIDKQPTAYDIDRKIEQLYNVKNGFKKCKSKNKLYLYVDGVMYLIDRIIDLLKE